MLEIPESNIISLQAGETLKGKVIKKVFTATSPHKFAFYCGDPSDYPELLTGSKITSTRGHGMFVDIQCDGNRCITIGDGTNMRYHLSSERPPDKHQLLITFEDGSALSFTVAMYGGIWAYKGLLDNKYHIGSLNSISPLDASFDESYFERIYNSSSRDLSLKALLATEQRIPGLGNGVLQDILFRASLHPKRKKSVLSGLQKNKLFRSIKETLSDMADKGGRDTEKDLFGNFGGYKTLLSKNTLEKPCPHCGNRIIKEAYMGGAVYYCPYCQVL